MSIIAKIKKSMTRTYEFMFGRNASLNLESRIVYSKKEKPIGGQSGHGMLPAVSHFKRALSIYFCLCLTVINY